MPNAYIVFHLNLAFSSIEECTRSTVINKCYWPLLNLIDETGIPVGVELTGWTLEQIKVLDPKWVERFTSLLNDERCELIGSGWSQIIGPLVPARVNSWNQRLGIDAYERVLHRRPSIALVNEMAYSTSMVNHYVEAGYDTIIMDRDNVRHTLGLESEPLSKMPTCALGLDGAKINVLWSDSVLFQRLQRVVHGDIPVGEYFEYVKTRVENDQCPVPIYCNDAEIFDFRPGRFSTEALLHPEGEWPRLSRLLNGLKTELKFLAPSKVVAFQRGKPAVESFFSTASNPIPVKKQLKYNIHRWATSGRGSVWLNSKCFGLYEAIKESSDATKWADLCEFWSSDYRTHITERRWVNVLHALEDFEQKVHHIPLQREKFLSPTHSLKALEEIKANSIEVRRNEEGIYWTVCTPTTQATVNVRRGLSLRSLLFQNEGSLRGAIGDIPQGAMESLPLAADFYSGNCVVEFPGLRKRLTDLEWVQALTVDTTENFSLYTKIDYDFLKIKKAIVISKIASEIEVKFEFIPKSRMLGTIRGPIFSLLPSAFPSTTCVKVANGGKHFETFFLEKGFDQTQAVSCLVSSNSAFGATTGELSLTNHVGEGIQFSWNQSLCALIPMIQHEKLNGKNFTRVIFTSQEFDDTFKEGEYNNYSISVKLKPINHLSENK